LFVNCEILSLGCIAVAHLPAQVLIVDKSEIMSCLAFTAFAIALFSTAFVEVVDRALSIEI
jgi:hypothetical protein